MTRDYPILPLEAWRQEIGYNPWHFWGLADSTIVPVTSKCNDVLHEYAWQDTDEAGRVDIRAAIIMAEQLLFDHMGYWAAPVYSVDTLPWPRYQDQRLFRTSRRDARGGWIPILLNEGHIRAIGIERHTLIDGAAVVTYADNDGDGLKENFSVTVATAVDPSEIVIYFTDGDRTSGDDDFTPRWRIEPVTVMAAGANVNIYGKRWQMVKPSLYEDKGHYPIDPTVDTNFVTNVEVYRRYTYIDGQVSTTDSQAALIWESRPCHWGCSTTNSSTDPASEGWITARAGIRDSLSGLVTPAEAVYNATTGTWAQPCECFSCCGEPDRVLIRYLAGLELDGRYTMQKWMRTTVTRLAAAEMTRRISACDQANREWSNWQFDVSRVNGPEQYQANLDSFNNPLGTRRGHLFAWQQIKRNARAVGTIS